MPNIASVLKDEISRLSNKAARQHVGPIQASTSSLRKQVSVLKKQLQFLEREVAALKKQARKAPPKAEPESDSKVRFTAKGLRSLRGRLSLSAEEFGLLVGVSAQTIYAWEGEKTQPRRSQIPMIAALRRLGKREARTRLEALPEAK